MKSIIRVIKYLIIVTIFVTAVGFILMNLRVPYNETMEIEAGDDIFSAAYFFKTPQGDAKYVTDVKSLDISHVGEYPITISLKGLKYKVVLKVVDTKLPVVTMKDEIEGVVGNIVDPASYIETLEDATECAIQYVDVPDFYEEGSYKVAVKVTDEGGNSVILTSRLKVSYDTTPPKIIGLKDLYVHLGDSIIYRDEIYVEDDQPGAILEIDNTQVDERNMGDYPVIYKATDVSGNVTKKSITLHILESYAMTLSDEEILSEFRKVYEEICPDHMNKNDKAYAIYNYVHEHIDFIPTSDKANYLCNAYEGLKSGKGDCVTCYSMMRVLMTMAEIDNICVVNVHKTHTFNMINCGDGWFYVDALYGGDEYFMMNEDEVSDKAKLNGNFELDYDNYPKTGSR